MPIIWPNASLVIELGHQCPALVNATVDWCAFELVEESDGRFIYECPRCKARAGFNVAVEEAKP